MILLIELFNKYNRIPCRHYHLHLYLLLINSVSSNLKYKPKPPFNMRISLAIPLTFVGASYAAVLVSRDIATIEAQFTAINSAVVAFDNDVVAISGTPDTDLLNAAAQAVVDQLNNSTAIVTDTDAVSVLDAINLVSDSNTLTSSVNKTITDLIAAKPAFDAAGASGEVLSQLEEQKTASQAFIAAVVSKVPDSVKSIANSQAQNVISALNTGITAFGGTVSKVRRGLALNLES